jgi:hypothetical protein
MLANANDPSFMKQARTNQSMHPIIINHLTTNYEENTSNRSWQTNYHSVQLGGT